MIFLECMDMAFTTWQIEDMLPPFTAAVKIACLAASLAPLFACLISSKDRDIPDMISRSATTLQRRKTCSGRSARCFSRIRLKTSFRICSLGQDAKPASMALQNLRTTVLNTLLFIKSRGTSTFGALHACSCYLLKDQHFACQSLWDSNLTTCAKTRFKFSLCCGPDLKTPIFLSFTF